MWPRSRAKVSLADLAERWQVVPASGGQRVPTGDLMALEDGALLHAWRQTRDEEGTLDLRGWYRLLYGELVVGKKLLDIGCGLALDTLGFVEAGASSLICVDLAASNVELVERVAGLLGVEERVTAIQVTSVDRLRELPDDIDVLFALGSLHHAPREIIERELEILREKVRPGGRWLQLAYPQRRWWREGSPSFETWGEMTDGPGTPWAEWYDLEKVLELLPGYEPVFTTEWHDSDFVWFDLVRAGS